MVDPLLVLKGARNLLVLDPAMSIGQALWYAAKVADPKSHSHYRAERLVNQTYGGPLPPHGLGWDDKVMLVTRTIKHVEGLR